MTETEQPVFNAPGRAIVATPAEKERSQIKRDLADMAGTLAARGIFCRPTVADQLADDDFDDDLADGLRQTLTGFLDLSDKHKERKGVFAGKFVTGTGAKAYVLERIESSEFWAIVFEQDRACFYEDLIRRHYADGEEDDAVGVILSPTDFEQPDDYFGVGILRKSRMLGPVYAKELERVELSVEPRTVVRHDTLFLMEPRRMEVARKLLFENTGKVE